MKKCFLTSLTAVLSVLAISAAPAMAAADTAQKIRSEVVPKVQSWMADPLVVAAIKSQLSLPVMDPATNEVIGAVTIGVNVELLQ